MSKLNEVYGNILDVLDMAVSILEKRLRAAAIESPMRSFSTASDELTDRSPGLRWARLAGTFLAGQGLVRLINMTVGLMLVHFLSIDQYALYTLASALLAVVVMGSNLGVSAAIITQGARLSHDHRALGGLFNAGLALCRKLYAATGPVFLGAAAVMLAPHAWPLSIKIAIVALVALTGWLRLPTLIAGAILNLNHDSGGLFRVGVGEAIVRLLLVPLCLIWPYAGLALLVGLAGAVVARSASVRSVGRQIDRAARPTAAQRAALRAFIIPLAPMVVYASLQGQIAVLILSLFGSTASIASVGAITRLNLIIQFGLLLSPFLVQPVMARQVDRGRFLGRLSLIVTALVVFSAAVMTSAFIVPHGWLWILGGSYAGLERELPIALATALLTLIGGTLYSVVVSRNRTAGQHWPILPSIAAQLVFVASYGVADAFDALLLSLFPALTYAVVQSVLLVRAVRDW